jgi:tetraacyldisaccharide 4'-kinase
MNILFPAGWLFGKLTRFRGQLYRRGYLHSRELGVPTVSVGNITLGGTGKTPLVAYVAEILAGRGHRVCILTRGYGREDPARRIVVSDFDQVFADARTGGDEPAELANRLRGKVAVIADADRASAGFWAKSNLGATAFVLDDGFQHLRLKRSLDIVCVDATDPFGPGRLLPAGTLREPPESLSRADAVMITRADQVENLDELISQVRKLAPHSEVFSCVNKIQKIEKLDEFCRHATTAADEEPSMRPERFWAFCALGNPSGFFCTIRQQLDIVATSSFSDHHRYTQADISRLAAEAAASGAEALITTAKDAVKLLALHFEVPCFVAIARVEVTDDARFRALF